MRPAMTMTLELRDRFWLIVAIGLSLMVRFPFMRMPIFVDEGAYAYIADRWLRGDGTLYQDLFIARPQGIVAVYAVIVGFPGDDTLAIRLASWIVAALTLLVVWWIARTAFGRETAAFAAILFGLLSGSPTLQGFTANAEMFEALPAAAVVALLIYAQRRGFPAKALVLAGTLTGIAILMKPMGIVMAPVACGYVFLTGSHHLKVILRRCLWFLIGAAAMGAVSLAHGYKVGWNDFWFASVTFRTRYQNTSAGLADNGWAKLSELIIHQQTLVLVVVIGIVWRWWTLRRGRPVLAPPSQGQHDLKLIHLWTIGSLLGMSMGGDWQLHYSIQIVAPLSIWLGYVVFSARDRLSGGLSWLPAIIMLLLILEVPLVIAAAGRGDPNLVVQHYARPKSIASPLIATYIQENTSPDDFIFVVGDAPQVYFLADRRAAVRYAVTKEIHAYPPAYDELVALIASPSRPEIIVDLEAPCRCELPNDGRAFWEQVKRHYVEETVVHGYTIYRAR